MVGVRQTFGKARRAIAATHCVSLALVSMSAGAHHSFAPYDAQHTVLVVGTIGSFHWSNPHVTFTVLVSKGAGAPQEWNVVTSNPAILKHFGWTGDSVRPGDRVSIECNPLSDGSHGGRLHTLTEIESGIVLRTKLSAVPQADAN
jgi:Family of unknown function (DUF6152)